MYKYMTIETINNSAGRGYRITAELPGTDTFRYKHMTYYGYSKKEAIARYRDLIGARGKHFTIIDL